MDKAQVKAVIATRAAKELKDGDIVNLGIGIPTLIPAYLPEGVNIKLQAECGMIDAGGPPSEDNADPDHVCDAGGQPSSIMTGGAFIDSSMSFTMIRGGHVSGTFLGALQVDEKGNLANWIIPGKTVPGMGGAMDLVVGANKVIVTMEHTAKGNHKILKECTLPLTAVNCVDMIITEMGVMNVTDKGIELVEIHPEFTVEDVQAATGAELIISPDLKPMDL
ncbi:MAG: 3-oxoacid CoA-transferase subunit B [Clostridia bacterium]|nr:3-oxoacid CoA-transferase subunit B [Clostridia bacterium]